MQLTSALNFVVLLFSIVNCSPTEPSEDTEVLFNVIEDATTLDLDGIGTNPGEFYKREVDEYISQKHLKQQGEHSLVTREINEEVVQHGDTVGLQSYVRNHWVGCAGTLCSGATCPQMMMTGNDWTNCWGEVFEIYRESGPGPVRVGDLIGLHYPRQKGAWLGCPGATCAKATCPGIPTTQNGFATDENWYRCWGEVFKIYAKGKNMNDTVHAFDDVMLFYLQSQLWVAQGSGNMIGKLPCPGTSRPPTLQRYDICACENFQIWKKK